ncbi:hypothetical protein J2Y69_001451 [Microbacterium resistens]|uniref:DUF4407 domain-containing protein n=1 Tax=Microbacterium resistens TaxID=156977 RepID=A0ABU1SB72_9MICO|nr:DUF4407 domain-containing protein [Microbacterium resistens]MDR6866852.1 hypothetical protein [Microbacterium resistens]
MSYSAHRPGRLDSQGQISFGVDGQSGDRPAADEPLEFVREYVPTGSEAVTAPFDPFDDAAPGAAEETSAVTSAVTSADAPSADAAHDAPTVAVSTVAPSMPAPSSLRGTAAEPTASSRPAAPAPSGSGSDFPSDSPSIPVPERAPKAPRPRRERARRVPGSAQRRMAILGGADGAILDRVPAETPRFVQMFFVLAGTALVSALSMFFALTTGVQVLVWLAIPLAIVWAAIIFNLDRFLTSTMTSTRSVWRLIGLAIPRVIMAALIGFVVAEPVVLQVFHNDIAREVAATNITQAQSDQDALEKGPEKKALDAASSRLKDLENQAATGVVAGTSTDSATQAAAQSTVDKVTAQMAEQQKVIDQARLLYQCELTGEGVGTVPGCTGVQGQGASSDASRAQLDQAQQTYDALAGQLRTANEELASAETAAKQNTSSSESQNRTEAEDQLPAARQVYDQALAAYDARASSVADGNAGAIGLLSQISGLNRLAEKEPTIFWAHWLIAALFFMIELLPVLVKVLTSFGDPSLYEKAVAIRKQVDLDRVSAQGFRDRAEIIAQGAADRAFADAAEAEAARRGALEGAAMAAGGAVTVPADQVPTQVLASDAPALETSAGGSPVVGSGTFTDSGEAPTVVLPTAGGPSGAARPGEWGVPSVPRARDVLAGPVPESGPEPGEPVPGEPVPAGR